MLNILWVQTSTTKQYRAETDTYYIIEALSWLNIKS